MDRQGVHLRGGQKDGSPQYVYLDEEDCDEDNTFLLNISQSSLGPRKIEVINVEIKPDDTLQALALRYSCTISALKQINKIDKENEIHAKPYIKVPVQPFSVLTETLTDKQECDDDDATSARSSEEEFVERELYDSTSTNIQSSGSEINTIILNSVCTPLLSHNNSEKISHTESDSLRSDRQRIGMMKEIFNCSGDDCGLSWRQLFVYTFLIVFVIPIIYIYLYVSNAFGRIFKRNETRND
ncbi:PREDICTED: lysM and putative peptidoglycan-binding domain-containing protein 3 isoform X1 [Dinoponera quadriceps]|uniref:LysM and putative peptidoglycan-binding domain-containing protein 3 isoform X1 n=1 Tax=Dinoponera quadriceps TaxID=609295 RepID=A0A6P3XNM6_DINQU|nr:PREDICTED: lysM and putative peptidoglycan-binding domain-containing protein 3 isoform X1 [Dinoponera quadriceps]